MEKVQDDGKVIAIISYITLIGLIVAFIMNNDKKIPLASYHIRQSLGLLLSGLVLSFVNVIPLLGQIIYLVGGVFLLVLWVMGLIAAINQKQEPVPVLGSHFQEWFSSIQ